MEEVSFGTYLVVYIVIDPCFILSMMVSPIYEKLNVCICELSGTPECFMKMVDWMNIPLLPA
jgi:hypothetical protein